MVDPTCGVEADADLGLAGGRIVPVEDIDEHRATIVDATGLLVCPGFFDMHVHLREPGFAHKETIQSGCRAAVAGGFAAVACMPNTKPAIDSVETVQWVLERAANVNLCRVYPIAAITVGRQGERVVDMEALKASGAVAFSDDGDGVERDDVMRRAFETAAACGATLIQHCEFKTGPNSSHGGVMHAGSVAKRLKLPGIDPRAEEAMIERDLELLRQVGGRYHVAHISTARAVDLVRQAKCRGLPVTAEVCTHHLVLSDEACAEADPNTKMHPPLRPAPDVAACVAGVADRTIDCIVTDHAPHTAEEKAVGFAKAPFGIIGLETAVGLAVKALIEPGLLDWKVFAALMCTHPYRVLGLPPPSLAPGQPATLTLIDPAASWTVDPARLHSKSHNTPFAGWTLPARAVAVMIDGNWAQRPEFKTRSS